MSKKTSNNAELRQIGGFCAFFALIISGILYIINLILNLFDTSTNLGILGQIASIFLVVSVILSGWQFKNTTSWGRKVGWTVVFWVFAILALVGSIGLTF